MNANVGNAATTAGSCAATHSNGVPPASSGVATTGQLSLAKSRHRDIIRRVRDKAAALQAQCFDLIDDVNILEVIMDEAERRVDRVALGRLMRDVDAAKPTHRDDASPSMLSEPFCEMTGPCDNR